MKAAGDIIAGTEAGDIQARTIVGKMKAANPTN